MGVEGRHKAASQPARRGGRKEKEGFPLLLAATPFAGLSSWEWQHVLFQELFLKKKERKKDEAQKNQGDKRGQPELQ